MMGTHNTSGQQSREYACDDGIIQVNIAHGMPHKEGTRPMKWPETEYEEQQVLMVGMILGI